MFSHIETLLWVEANEKHRVISALVSCWLITVDTYLLMPSSAPNHTIPTMHREDIFLCRNLLSEWAFQLGSDGKSKTPPAIIWNSVLISNLGFRINFNSKPTAYFEKNCFKVIFLLKVSIKKGREGEKHVLCIARYGDHQACDGAFRFSSAAKANGYGTKSKSSFNY